MEKFELYYNDETNLAPLSTETMFEELFMHIALKLKLDATHTMSVTIVSLERIQEINRLYRQLDKPTDVISFAFLEGDFNSEEPVVDLGEICISLEVAKNQAKEYSHPLMRELAFLFIHGTLHLFGYDHVNSEEEANAMYELQNEILNSFVYDYGRSI